MLLWCGLKYVHKLLGPHLNHVQALFDLDAPSDLPTPSNMHPKKEWIRTWKISTIFISNLPCTQGNELVGHPPCWDTQVRPHFGLAANSKSNCHATEIRILIAKKRAAKTGKKMWTSSGCWTVGEDQCWYEHFCGFVGLPWQSYLKQLLNGTPTTWATILTLRWLGLWLLRIWAVNTLTRSSTCVNKQHLQSGSSKGGYRSGRGKKPFLKKNHLKSERAFCWTLPAWELEKDPKICDEGNASLRWRALRLPLMIDKMLSPSHAQASCRIWDRLRKEQAHAVASIHFDFLHIPISPRPNENRPRTFGRKWPSP